MKDISENLNIVAIIPARGGSKGIPNKNIVSICGHPLISWSISQAISSKRITSVWVSSDDQKILDISKQYGSNIIERPPELATDISSSESAWIHSIDYLSDLKIFPDLIVGIQATSPIRDYEDLDNAIENFIINNYESLFTASELEDNFMWGFDKSLNPFPLNYDMNNRKPRNQISKSYLENGSFYIFKPQSIKKFNNRLYGKIGIYIMEKYKSFQIDKDEDIKICTAIMKEYDLKQ